jgi:hypothetical protein
MLSATALAALASACSSGERGGGVRGFYRVTSGSIDVTFDPAVLQQLRAAGLTVGAEPPGRGVSAGDLRFPVESGTLRIGSLAGTVDSAGSLTLAGPQGRAFTASGLNASSGIVTAVIDGKRQQLLTYRVPYVLHRGSTDAGTYTWSSADATLSRVAVTAMNHSLGVTVFSHTVVATIGVTASVARS